MTTSAGDALRRILGYRGAFSIDGILTPAGFRPTDLNARLTSAMEAAPSSVRVRLQMANILARQGKDLDSDRVRNLAHDAFNGQQTYTLYGVASRATQGKRQVYVRWQGRRLAATSGGQAHGRLTVSPALRGWLLTATLDRDHVPRTPVNQFATQVFEISDTMLGTDFGTLEVPHGVPVRLDIPAPSAPGVRAG